MEHLFARQCSHCKKGMNEGFVIEGGVEYYCSKTCRNHYYSDEDWNDMYDEEFGDSYWTEWEDLNDYQYILTANGLKQREDI
jgi:hypothetical protein